MFCRRSPGASGITMGPKTADDPLLRGPQGIQKSQSQSACNSQTTPLASPPAHFSAPLLPTMYSQLLHQCTWAARKSTLLCLTCQAAVLPHSSRLAHPSLTTSLSCRGSFSNCTRAKASNRACSSPSSVSQKALLRRKALTVVVCWIPA